MDYRTKLDFNGQPSTVMHIDINSCFASIEQQANPLLRGKPVAVAAYDTPNGCILAPSIEAKKMGVKVGMRVKEGKLFAPDLIVLKPDANKYRDVHLKLRDLLLSYTSGVVPKSIDEFVLNFSSTPAFSRGLFSVSEEIKARIKSEIGDNLTVSIGIAPNRFLAKTASNLHKPDGLDEINKDNFWSIYQKLTLTDLNGIDRQNSIRLNNVGIYTVHDFYLADIRTLHSAFKSIVGYYWFLRLRGWEIDDVEWGTKSFGHSYSLPKFVSRPTELAPILSKLVEKTGFRMRSLGFQARGVHLGLLYGNYEYFHKGITLDQPIFASQDIYRTAYLILTRAPRLPIRNLAVSCFGLSLRSSIQLELFSDIIKKDKLTGAIDAINKQWGNFVIAPAIMANTQNHVHDRISFGNV